MPDSSGRPSPRSSPRSSPEPQAPPGLIYVPGFVDVDEEQRFLARGATLEFDEIRMRGQVARRTVRHFGYHYDYTSSGVTPGDPMPAWLQGLRERCAQLAQLPTEALAQALLTRYPPGASIGWHRDAAIFGDAIVGVSLGAGCQLRFRRDGDDRRFELTVAARSAYVLSGPARHDWRHHIPPVREPRVSVTFRTLREGIGAQPTGVHSPPGTRPEPGGSVEGGHGG